MTDRDLLEWLLSLTLARRERVCKIVKVLSSTTRGQISRIDALVIAHDVLRAETSFNREHRSVVAYAK